MVGWRGPLGWRWRLFIIGSLVTHVLPLCIEKRRLQPFLMMWWETVLDAFPRRLPRG